MIPTAADRATSDGSKPVIVGSEGSTTAPSGASANAIGSVDGTVETGGRAAGSNQQRAEGQFPKQVKEVEKGAPVADQ